MKYHSFFKHLIDQKMLIGIFVLIIIFVDVIFFLDPQTRLSESNVLYIDLFIILCLFVFLFFDYNKKQKVFKTFNSIEQAFREIKSVALNNEQRLYFRRLSDNYVEKETEMAKIIEEKKEYREFINNWVHDIKTPISVMELILETECTEQAANIGDSLKEELRRISEKVERALYFSKLDSFNQDYFIEETDVYKIVRDVVKSNSLTFITKKIGIEIPEKPFMIHTDRKWLRFIIHQIVSNSLKYTPKKGSISFFHEVTEKAFILKIKDNGCGIKKEDIKRIFNNGFTGYNGRKHPASTGLGLYLATKLCKKLNFKIQAESEFGSFTLISIHIPKTNDFLNVTQL